MQCSRKSADNRGFWALFNFLNMRKCSELNFAYLPQSDDARLVGCWHIATNESTARRPCTGDPDRPGTTQNALIFGFSPRVRPFEGRFWRRIWAELSLFRIFFPKAPPCWGDVTRS